MLSCSSARTLPGWVLLAWLSLFYSLHPSKRSKLTETSFTCSLVSLYLNWSNTLLQMTTGLFRCALTFLLRVAKKKKKDVLKNFTYFDLFLIFFGPFSNMAQLGVFEGIDIILWKTMFFWGGESKCFQVNGLTSLEKWRRFDWTELEFGWKRLNLMDISEIEHVYMWWFLITGVELFEKVDSSTLSSINSCEKSQPPDLKIRSYP